MNGDRYGLIQRGEKWECIDRVVGQVWTFDSFEEADAKLEWLRARAENGGSCTRISAITSKGASR